MCLELCTLHPRLDRDLLLSAAIVHDLGKTREFAYGAEITRSERGIVCSATWSSALRLIAEHAPSSLRADRRLALEHCVLLHHGPDAAAGRGFASAEALALYRVNALDAHVKGALEGSRAPVEHVLARSRPGVEAQCRTRRRGAQKERLEHGA